MAAHAKEGSKRHRWRKVQQASRLRRYGPGYRLLGVEVTAEFHRMLVAQAAAEGRPIASLCRRALAGYLQTVEALRAAGKLPIPREMEPVEALDPPDVVEI